MTKTVRLLMPQWQGGMNQNYAFGSELLAWLAPENPSDTVIRVPISQATELKNEAGITGRSVLLEQLLFAKKALEEEQPDKLIVFGGDCLVEQAPVDYLVGKYGEKLGVIWIDAHPDVSTPKETNRGHAMVLGNLLGQGDHEFASQVTHRLQAEKVVYVGLEQPAAYERAIVDKLSIKDIRHTEVEEMLVQLNQWMKEQGIEYVMIHLDVDVLNSRYFRSTLFSNPDGVKINAPEGTMTLADITELVVAVAKKRELVGFGITEHLPWDVINLKNTLQAIPIFSGK